MSIVIPSDSEESAFLMLRPGELEIAENAPPAGCSPETAQQYTRWLATHHYENFNVASWLLPKELHQHFYNLYAYCRWADDLGDEVPDAQRALELLDWWEHELDACYEGRPSHPVFVALRETIVAKDIPKQPFADLLKAFRQDQTVKRYPTWDVRSRLLRLFRESRRPPGALSLRLSRRSSARNFPTPPAPRCSSRISGRTFRATSKKAASTFRSTSPRSTASAKTTSSSAASATTTSR